MKKILFYRIFCLMMLSLLSAATFGQNARTITGKVTDSGGTALPGTNVIVLGTKTGVQTDINGNYTIIVQNPASDILEFSFIGYTKLQVSVGNRSSVDAVLAEEYTGIDEIVVIGYGTQKKSDVTGSVVSVSNEEITARPVNNVFQALQGKAAGVDITTSLRPGTLGSISIRGARSLTASNSPLYVVDGIPILSNSGIETLNEQDIESIEILKDASATAI